MADWLNPPSVSFLGKQPRLRVTVYGPYGPFTARLKTIAKSLRGDHGFSDAYIVWDRIDFRARQAGEKEEQYFKSKSYHYLGASDVNLFFFYCHQYNDSAELEFKEVCDRLPHKLPCCAVFKDKTCRMAMLLKGEIADANVLVDEFNGRSANCDKEVAKLAAARCMNFLKVKYSKIP